MILFNAYIVITEYEHEHINQLQITSMNEESERSIPVRVHSSGNLLLHKLEPNNRLLFEALGLLCPLE